MTASTLTQTVSESETKRSNHRAYMRKWRRENAVKNIEYNRDYKKKNEDKWKEYRKKDCERRRKNKLQNPEKYRDKDRASYRARNAKRRAALLKRTPAWVDLEKIRLIYVKCARLCEETGLEYQVDHIIPLQGKTVSGLHVHNNLQIITAKENQKKLNILLPEFS